MLGVTVGRICGNSMLPKIVPNSFIIAIKYPRFLPKRAGQIYCIQHPRHGCIVKTLKAIEGEAFWFAGESEASISTEAIGKVYENDLLGRVVWVIAPPP